MGQVYYFFQSNIKKSLEDIKSFRTVYVTSLFGGGCMVGSTGPPTINFSTCSFGIQKFIPCMWRNNSPCIFYLHVQSGPYFIVFIIFMPHLTFSVNSWHKEQNIVIMSPANEVSLAGREAARSVILCVQDNDDHFKIFVLSCGLNIYLKKAFHKYLNYLNPITSSAQPG